VQFARALAQEPGTLQVRANEAVDRRRGTRVEQGEQRVLGHGGGSDGGLPCLDLCEVAPDRVLGISPGIPQGWQEDLQHGQREGFLVRAPIFQGPSHRGNIAEVARLGQIASHFQVGVDAFMQASVQLEHEQVAIHHRGIALVCLQGHRL
jgi:hypothetical protein